MTVQRYSKRKVILITIGLAIWYSLIWVALSHAADNWYVTQSGAGSNASETGAWVSSPSSVGQAMSVAQFNNSVNWINNGNIDPGDTVFFSGTITSGISLPSGQGGLSGNYITIDGWEGGTCNPVADHDPTTFGSDNNIDLGACPDAALVDLDSTSTNGITLNSNDYIILQDFEVRDSNHGIILNGTTSGIDYVTVRRNYVHDCYRPAFTNYLGGTTNDYNTIGGALGDGNFFYNNSEINRTVGITPQHVNLTGNNLIFSYNEVSSDFVGSSSFSSNSIEVHEGNYQLLEYNSVSYSSPDALISLKKAGGQYKIVRFNKLFKGRYAISISTDAGNENVYVYGNFMYDITDQLEQNGLGQALRCFYSYDNIHFWSNVISYTDSRGIAVFTQSGNTQGNVYVYNNTVYKAGQNSALSADNRNGLYIYSVGDALRLNVKNNIISDSDISTYNQIYNNQVPDAYVSSWDENQYYYTGQTAQIYWTSSYTGSLMSTLVDNSAFGDNGEVSDPSFVDANGTDNTDGTADDNLRLDTGSTAINAGEDLSQCFYVAIQGVTQTMCYDHGLDPDGTDWTTTPPTVAVISRDDHGWSRGAYVYTTSTSPPIVSVSNGDNYMSETSGSSARFQINCTPSADCVDVVVTYAFSGTATYTDDYTARAPASQTQVTLTGAATSVYVDVEEDSTPEPTETVILTVIDGAAYDLGAAYISQPAYIYDDDGVVYDYGKTSFR